jgi:hypothetical protein
MGEFHIFEWDYLINADDWKRFSAAALTYTDAIDGCHLVS